MTDKAKELIGSLQRSIDEVLCELVEENELLADAYRELENIARNRFDGMTNGEVIGLLFQNTDIYHTYYNQNFMLRELVFTDEWWDAPYKAESEVSE